MKRNKISMNFLTEYKKRIFSDRFICAIALMLVLLLTHYSGTVRFLEAKNVNITPWAAVSLLNFSFDTTIFGFIVCYMYSDIPFMNREELPFLLRKGRIKWYIDKLLAIILQAITFVFITFISCALCFIPRLEFSLEWGKVFKTLARSTVGSEYSAMQVSSEMIRKYKPIEAMLLSFAITATVVIMVGILVFTIALVINRVAGMVVGMCLSTLSLASDNMITHTIIPHVIYLCPFSWCDIGRFDVKFFKVQYGTFESYMTICAIVITICVVVGLLRIRKAEFNWNRED